MKDMEGKRWTGAERMEEERTGVGGGGETERDKRKIRVREPGSDLGLYICFALWLHMSNGLDLLFSPRASSLPFFPPLNFQRSRVCFSTSH